MIHAPRLMPDESAMGYWGRVLRLNAVRARTSDEKAFTAHLRKQIATNRDEKPEMASVISAVAGIKLSTLVRFHTLVPVNGAVLAVVGGDWCDNSYPCRELRRRAMEASSSSRMLCQICVGEDLPFWGFSYWRRSHQVTGIVWCQKHGCPLFRARENKAWRSMPHEVMRQVHSVSEAVVTQALESPVLRRYAKVCTELLDRAKPLSTLQVVRTLANRADVLKLTTNLDDRNPRLSDFAADCIGGPWKDLFWKELSDKQPGAHLPNLDGALSRLRAGTQASGYALAIALLYDSVEPAFRDLERPLPSPESLVATIDAAALRLARNELPRSAEANECRRKRLRLAVERVLSGEAIHSTAGATGWSVLVLERVLLKCVTKLQVREPAFAILTS